ncbi:hypothetical protein ACIBFB_25400 [Nocardiopsis sp. NPDC050513]|uniref:hypothetical protein n=1 Tax=Nocardiopsis sp. NPDC050513 TaxID=3364338 RepID=UPI0037A18A05
MRARRRGRRPLRLVLCVALGGAVLALQWLRVADHDVLGPIASSGDRGSVVATDEFTVEVTDVRVAGTVTDSSPLSPEPIEANGVWVVVWVRVTATREPLTVTRAELEMADRTTYAASLWFRDALSGGTEFPTAVPVRGAFVFEVPEDRVDRPSLVFTHTGGSGSRLAAQASVDLGVDAAAVTGATVDVELAPPERGRGEAADAPP